MEEVVIERMAPSSLKKMSGSGAGKEGNYASLKESTSLDVFTSDDLGLTLLPGPQTQTTDEGEKVQAAIGRHTKICTTKQQENSQPRSFRLDERWHPVTRRSTVDESLGGSCYLGLSKGVERYSTTGSHDDDAVVRPDKCCSGIQGKRDLKRNDFSSLTETFSKNDGDGHHYEKNPIPKHSGPTHASFLAKERREVECDILFDSANQMFKEEVKNIGLNEASGSLGSVVGNKYDSGRQSDTTACENSLEYGFCGSKGKKSENLLRTSSSGNLGMTTKPTTDHSLSTSYPLSCSNNSVERPRCSARPHERQFTYPAVTGRNNESHSASAFLAPVELQGSRKARATAPQQALNSSQLSPQLILKQPQASRNLHAASPKKVSKPVKQLKRSWTRHFPPGSKNLPSRSLNSDHAHPSSATLSFSIGSKTHSNFLRACFAYENRCKFLAHLNPRTLAISPPIHIETSSRASYGLKCHTFDNRANTGIVQSHLKAGIKRSKSLPEFCLPHLSSIMDQQPGHQANQFPTPPTEPHALGDNSQYLGSNHTLLPPNHEAHPVRGETHGDMNRPLMGMHYENMQGDFSQLSQSLANPNMGAPTHRYENMQGDFSELSQSLADPNMGAPTHRYPPVQLLVHGSNNETRIDYPVATNHDFRDSNGERLYTTAEYMTVVERCNDLSRRNDIHAEALNHARARDQISQAKIKEQERTIINLRQKSETTKTAKPPKEGVKTKSSGNGSVASTVEWARKSHPIARQQNTNARSASLDSSPMQLTDKIDGTLLESGANMLTMFSPTQGQHASVPALATGFPATQATPIPAPYCGSFQPGAQYAPGPYNPVYPPDLVYPPYPQQLGQYSFPVFQPVHSFQNQGNQFQQSPGYHSVESYQQLPQLFASHAIPAAAQAEASTVGVKRKREAEPDAVQGVKRQQQPVGSQPGVSPEKAVDNDHASSEAWRKRSEKTLGWLEGFNPYQHKSNDTQQLSAIPSASLSQASPLPALAAQAPMRLIAPTPGKAPKKTTQKSPNKRKEPMSTAERKVAKAQYNKTYRESKKGIKRNERMQAAETGEASEATSPPSNADSNEDGLHDSVEEEIDGNDQISISDDDDLWEGSSIPEETTTHLANGEITDHNDLGDPSGLSAEDLAWATEQENLLMLEDGPTDQAVENATEGIAQRITKVENEESEESEAE